MRVYCLVLLVMHSFLEVEGAKMYGWIIYKHQATNCDYQFYTPAGKEVREPGQIKAQTAELAKSGLASILKPVSQALPIVMHSMNAAKGIMGAFKTVAPKLGPVLGLFGAASGVFNSLTSPTQGDIMDAVNEVLLDLVADINGRLKEMKNYVDDSVIHVEKKLISRAYTSKLTLWKLCAKRATYDLAQLCQITTFDVVVAARAEFAIYADKLKDGVALTGLETKELEAYLVAYRNWANLIVMMLIPLIETYRDDNSPSGKTSFNRYANDLEEQAKFFVWYSKAAMEAILKHHNGPESRDSCSSTVHCGRLSEIHEPPGSLFSVHTADETYCSCVIDPNTNQKCNRKVTIRLDGKKSTGYYYYKSRSSTKAGVAVRFFKYNAKKLVKEYVAKNVAMVKAYWQKQLLDFIPEWEDAIKFAKTALQGTGEAASADVPSGDGEPSGGEADAGESSKPTEPSNGNATQLDPDLAKAAKEAEEVTEKINEYFDTMKSNLDAIQTFKLEWAKQAAKEKKKKKPREWILHNFGG